MSRLEALFAKWAELGVDGWTGVSNQMLRLKKEILKQDSKTKDSPRS